MQRSTIDQLVLREKDSGKQKQNTDGSIINVFDTNPKIGRELQCSVLVFQFRSSKRSILSAKSGMNNIYSE